MSQSIPIRKNFSSFSCLQINTRHCKAASASLSQLALDNNYDIICVQEPYASLPPISLLSISNPSPRVSNIPPGYRCFHNLNKDHAYGALIFARSSLNARLCPNLSSNNISVIEFKCNSVSIFIVSAYLRPTYNNPEDALHQLCNLLKNDTQTTIFCIDSNAKNKLWGSSHTDAKGTAMESAIIAKNLNILNIAPDECLFTPLDTSFIDITLAGDKLSNISWSYLDLPSLSDHPYINFTFGLSSCLTPKLRTSHPVPKLQHVMIEALLPSLSAQVSRAEFPLATRKQTETSISKLSQIITESAIKHKKKVDRIASQPPKMPWWNEKLANHRQRMRKAYKKWYKYKNSNSATSLQIDNLRILYKKEAAFFQRSIRETKRETWKTFCTNNMNSDLLTTLRYLAKKEKCSGNPSSLLVDGKITKSPVDISKAFAEHFFKPVLPSSECHKKLE
jgi:hypothetical protein